MYNSTEFPVIKIMLLDDHTLVAEGFRELLLKILPSGSVINTFSSLKLGEDSLKTGGYGVIMTDLVMPGQNVIEFITSCKKSYGNIIILVVTSVIDSSSIKACLMAGANGYLSKAVDPREIKLALEHTLRGKRFISSDLSGSLADNILSMESSVLTSKELEILRLIAAGKTTKNIAEVLFISPITVMTHKRNIMRKLNLNSATQLVRYVYENNLA